MSALVEERLAHYGQLTAAATAPYLAGIEPRGHLRDLVADYPARGGKSIRPALCLATCVAFGGRVEDAVPSAIAIELLHNAFLVHDDIEDASLLRRGEPTLHASHGVPLALNAGDALALLANAPLRDNRSHLSSRMAALIAEEFDLMARRTLEGQATELGWRRDNVIDLDPSDYLDLVLRKTCWYTTIHPLRVGALIGSWATADLDRLVRFGFYLGAAFQIADDLLNLTGDADPYGKEPLGDLFEGKRTLMVIHLLKATSGRERAGVVEFLGRERADRTEHDVRQVLDLMRRRGSLEFAERFGEGIAAAATETFAEAFGSVDESTEVRFVREMIRWMLERPA
ncbi:MAG: polyprenyl synthetase family protein [Acidimicrobiales bacterium]